jgi:hypothetical protein
VCVCVSGLARPARHVVRAVALGGHLLPRPAAAAVHARAVRVLVGARGLESPGPARLAVPIDTRLRAHVADALHMPGAPVRRLARIACLADHRTCVVCGRVYRADLALIQACVGKDLGAIDLDFTQMKILEWHVD